MNNDQLLIQIPVDLTNPGQFFACCGLLELADRFWPRADSVGGFEIHRFDCATFRIWSRGHFTSQLIVAALLGSRRKAVDPWQPIRGSDGKLATDAEKTKPVLIGAPVNLRLAWWLDEFSGTQTQFKTWSANTTSLGLFESTAVVVDPSAVTDMTLLTHAVGMTGRFGFDPRSSWDTLNTGYSPNDQGDAVDSYPATELVAAIGLQTFPPLAVNDHYYYTPWEQPLPAIAARTVACGAIKHSNTRPYRFAVQSRGKFKNFSKAELVPRSTHER